MITERIMSYNSQITFSASFLAFCGSWATKCLLPILLMVKILHCLLEMLELLRLLLARGMPATTILQLVLWLAGTK